MNTQPNRAMRRHSSKSPGSDRNKANPPMLVTRTLANTEMEIRERQCINAFTHGVAKEQHFDLLLLMMNLLLIAGQTSPERKYALDYAEQKIKPVIVSIRGRFGNTGKLGVNALELKALRDMVDFSREFWLRQPGELWVYADKEVCAYYDELAAKRRAAA
ncbi:hypothetical protein LG200_05215 [Methylobacillus caricis]|uniref:hypothetical protein n=1 Tax=Methylobacillus caricis TaxID=1971611 RepID=UPI001CFFDD46|nr:hypothetical protein [Methylobacillus caricis]MCB5187404.1 hypothetical protein [Methylobacillus caricis]